MIEIANEIEHLDVEKARKFRLSYSKHIKEVEYENIFAMDILKEENAKEELNSTVSTLAFKKGINTIKKKFRNEIDYIKINNEIQSANFLTPKKATTKKRKSVMIDIGMLEARHSILPRLITTPNYKSGKGKSYMDLLNHTESSYDDKIFEFRVLHDKERLKFNQMQSKTL